MLAVIDGNGRRFSPLRKRPRGNIVLRRGFDARTGRRLYSAAMTVIKCQSY